MKTTNQVLILISCILLLVGWCGAICPDSCPTAVKPVCARDEDGNTRTFSNKCQVNRYNCQRAATFAFSRDGPCLSNSPSKGNVEDPPKRNNSPKRK